MCAASAARGGGALAACGLGRVDYLAAWRLQEAVATRVRRGDPERLLLLEHAPVYTIGRRGPIAHLVASPAVLRAAGASVYRVDRGGGSPDPRARPPGRAPHVRPCAG